MCNNFRFNFFDCVLLHPLMQQCLYRRERLFVGLVFIERAIGNEIIQTLVQVFDLLPGHRVARYAHIIRESLADITVGCHNGFRIFERTFGKVTLFEIDIVKGLAVIVAEFLYSRFFVVLGVYVIVSHIGKW